MLPLLFEPPDVLDFALPFSFATPFVLTVPFVVMAFATFPCPLLAVAEAPAEPFLAVLLPVFAIVSAAKERAPGCSCKGRDWNNRVLASR